MTSEVLKVMRLFKLFFFVAMGLLVACGSPDPVPLADPIEVVETGVVETGVVDTEAVATEVTEIEVEPEPEAVLVEPEPEPAPETIMDQLAREYAYINFASAEVDPGFAPVEWLVTEPEAQGLDGAQLAKLAPFLADDMSHMHSVVVVRNDVLVYEYYKEGRSRYSADIVWSVTKSITSLLIGIASDEGLLTLDDTLAELLSAEQLSLSDPNLDDVTIRELLTMTSGVACPGDRCHDATVSMMLGKDLNDEPGNSFVYDTGSTHLLAAVLGEVTGMTFYEYAAEKLFFPLGIEPPPWQLDSEGIPFGGKGLAIRPRDMARVGQLLLNEGVWAGEQLVSADYIEQATQNQVADVSNEAYGYLFWIDQESEPKRYSAVGYGGQYITVIPDYDLVVVITSDFNRARSGNDDIIDPFIIEAITDSN